MRVTCRDEDPVERPSMRHDGTGTSGHFTVSVCRGEDRSGTDACGISGRLADEVAVSPGARFWLAGFRAVASTDRLTTNSSLGVASGWGPMATTRPYRIGGDDRRGGDHRPALKRVEGNLRAVIRQRDEGRESPRGNPRKIGPPENAESIGPRMSPKTARPESVSAILTVPARVLPSTGSRHRACLDRRSRFPY